ncbi:MAG: outer membrane protein assembly factor [Akkermansiaceae bacterium]
MPSRIHILIAALISALCVSADAAELRLSGIPLDKREKLVAQLSPRLDFIKTREPSAWRADDAAFFLKRLLIRSGHADAQVEWELPGGNVILLKAKSGPQYRFGQITTNQSEIIKGSELRDYFLQPLVETEVVDADDAPYIASYDDAGAENVANLLRSRGYWKASVRIARKRHDKKDRQVDIHLDLQPGAQHLYTWPKFSGTTPTEIEKFRTEVQPYVGKVADTEALSKTRLIVENYYHENGYEFASISVIPRHNSGLTQLTFKIDRGKLFKVDDIIITGANNTERKRIRRYFDSLRHKPFNKKKANAALSKLLSTGNFKRASLTPIPDESGKLDLQIEVNESRARSLRSYVGVGSYEGFILGASYTNLNFTGRLLRLNIRGELSGRGFLGETSLTEPHFAGEAIQLNMRAFLLQRTYEGYDKTEGGIEASLLWSPADTFSTRLYAGASAVSASSTSLTAIELGPENYLHTRAGIQQTIDYRDSVTLPTKGFYASALLDFGSVSGDASTSYLRAQIDSSYRYPINKKQHLMARLSSGAIQPSDSLDLPIDLRLFSGGADSLRSYNSRELGPRSFSDDPLGGEAYWNASLEYIREVSDPIKAVFFLDAGQVYSDFSDLSFNDLSYAAGIGLRIDLPIGPVRLEYGHNLNRKDGEPSGTLHFAIGTTF